MLLTNLTILLKFEYFSFISNSETHRVEHQRLLPLHNTLTSNFNQLHPKSGPQSSQQHLVERQHLDGQQHLVKRQRQTTSAT
jgi:hypothetical protein